MITSRYFSVKEMSCHHGCGFLPTQKFMDLLDQIRAEYGHAISVTNIARCSVHNRAVGGAPNSAHVEGIAADLVYTPELFAFINNRLDHFGIWMENPNATPGWIHIDTRYRPVGRVFIP